MDTGPNLADNRVLQHHETYLNQTTKRATAAQINKCPLQALNLSLQTNTATHTSLTKYHN